MVSAPVRRQQVEYAQSYNGPKFVGHAVLKSMSDAGNNTALNDPGKPLQDGADESFNGKSRDECLDTEWFWDRVECKVIIE